MTKSLRSEETSGSGDSNVVQTAANETQAQADTSKSGLALFALVGALVILVVVAWRIGKLSVESAKRFLMLAAALVGPAIFSYAVASGVEYKFTSQMREAVLAGNTDPNRAAAYEKLTMQMVCGNSAVRADLPDACSTTDNLELMKSVSVGVAVLSIFIILAIWLAGIFSQASRTMLLGLFGPGLYLTMALTALIVVLDAALLFGSVYYGESALIGRIHIGIMLALAVGALAGVATMIQASYRSLKRATSQVMGKKLTEKSAPALWQYVIQLASKLGALPPQNIVVGLDPNFYVTEANVICLDGTLTGRTLYMSLPLCRILSEDELTAVIGHELGHFVGQDTKFSLRFYPVYRGATDAVVNLQSMGQGNENSKSGAMLLPLIPAMLILGHFLNSFAAAENGIGRTREIEADKVGASLGGPKNIAAALVKIHAFTPLWLGMDAFLKEKLSQGLSIINASSLYAQVVQGNSTADSLKGLDASRMVHPTDSHPPLGERLNSLGVPMSTVADAALKTAPEKSAVLLVDNYESVEKELSDFKQMLMVKLGEVTLPPPAEEEKKSA